MIVYEHVSNAISAEPCVVATAHDTRIRNIGWKQVLGPVHFIACRPCLLAMAIEPVDEYNACPRK